MSLNNVGSKVGLVAAGAVAAGALVVGGAALADAATRNPSGAAANGYGGYAGGPGASGGYGQRGGSSDTPVTGDELAKVTAAVKAKDSAVTVTSVQKDPDGSYDVFGTKAGRAGRFRGQRRPEDHHRQAAGRRPGRRPGRRLRRHPGDRRRASQGDRRRQGQGLGRHRHHRPQGPRRLLRRRSAPRRAPGPSSTSAPTSRPSRGPRSAATAGRAEEGPASAGRTGSPRNPPRAARPRPDRSREVSLPACDVLLPHPGRRRRASACPFIRRRARTPGPGSATARGRRRLRTPPAAPGRTQRDGRPPSSIRVTWAPSTPRERRPPRPAPATPGR